MLYHISSTHNERKRHNGRRNIEAPLTILEETANFLYHIERRSDKSEDEDKYAQIHKIFYAELIKLFVIESEGIKPSKLTEVELDQNIILSAEEYYNTNNDIYEVSDNSYKLKILLK